MQDRNGKDIYKGDIVYDESNHDKYEVKWNEEQKRFDCLIINSEDISYAYFSEAYAKKLFVVAGNIHSASV